MNSSVDICARSVVDFGFIDVPLRLVVLRSRIAANPRTSIENPGVYNPERLDLQRTLRALQRWAFGKVDIQATLIYSSPLNRSLVLIGFSRSEWLSKRKTAMLALLGKESTCSNWLNNYIIGLVTYTSFGYGELRFSY